MQNKRGARLDNFGKYPKNIKVSEFETPHMLWRVGRAKGSRKSWKSPKARGFEHLVLRMLQEIATRHMKPPSQAPHYPSGPDNHYPSPQNTRSIEKNHQKPTLVRAMSIV